MEHKFNLGNWLHLKSLRVQFIFHHDEFGVCFNVTYIDHTMAAISSNRVLCNKNAEKYNSIPSDEGSLFNFCV